MKRCRTLPRWGGLAALLLLSWSLTALTAPEPAALPVIDLSDYGYQPVSLTEAAHQLDSTPVLAATTKTAVTLAETGQKVVYTLTLANSDRLTHTVTLRDTLPPQLQLTAVSPGLTVITNTVTWTGTLPPGNLDYVLAAPGDSLPYVDLADFGLPNLCDPFLAAGEDCDEQTVTFNLGASGYRVHVYGETRYQVVLHTNGVVLLDGAVVGLPHWLPGTAVSGPLLAGLWQDLDLTQSGRWHAAILSGYLAGHDVFYAQWQDAPHAADPDLTSRFAIVLVLDKSQGAQPLNGHIFYLYDHISQPDKLTALGYSIGLQDTTGGRGFTYAYAGTEAPPRGTPPTGGTTLHWAPAYAGEDYQRTFTYTATVIGTAPDVAVNTAQATWDDGHTTWDTHYLFIRHLTYLPLIRHTEAAP